MQAGRMRYRLELLEPVKSVSGSGACAEAYVPRGTAHAERVRMSGRRVEEVGEHFADYHVEFNVRDAHPVRDGWRVRQLGGDLYAVTNVVPNRERGMLTLVCDRVNV